MLGVVAELTHHKIGQCRVAMLTQAEWDERALRRAAQLANLSEPECPF